MVNRIQNPQQSLISLMVVSVTILFGFCPTARAGPGRGESFAGPAHEALQRGENLRSKWILDGAEAAFREAAALEPASLEAALGLARVARAKIEFARAIRLLDKADGEHPNSVAVLSEYGSIYLAAEEPDQARRYFERALRVSPSDISAIIGLACADLLDRTYERATNSLRQAVQREPQNSFARAMLARALMETGDQSGAAEEARQAIALDAYNAEALFVLAYVKSSAHQADESRSLARRVVSLDSYHFSGRRLLSQYLDGQTGYEQRVSTRARIHYANGKSLKEEGQLVQAAGEFEAALRIEPRYYRALIGLADLRLRQRDYERAGEAAALAITVDPDGAIAHFELSCAHRGINEKARLEIGGVHFEASSYQGRTPAAYALTRKIFPNYGSLTRRDQAVIDASVEPLAFYLPKLVQQKARHFLLSFDQRPSDQKGFADVAGERTFDGRFYASIRGVGGLVTVSGIEYLDQAALGGFNTIAHEFAHQVHIAALGKGELKEIRRLYESARREGRTLDYYAAGNEDEYFAQGYEAFISESKRPAAGITGRHTRYELLTRDPELYRFLVNLASRRPR
jgi:tetratricopeptide (TPR) repeat protein